MRSSWYCKRYLNIAGKLLVKRMYKHRAKRTTLNPSTIQELLSTLRVFKLIDDLSMELCCIIFQVFTLSSSTWLSEYVR